ncbi:MAG TPA: hypothetical protein VGS21_04330, partial [Acidimicrobiales bacterium]|nr:hypothetical protein [Acidimicrobiales bacterium]
MAVRLSAGLFMLVGAVVGVGTAAIGERPPTTAATSPPGYSTIGLGGWEVQSSASVTQTGQQISTPGFDTSGWLKVTPDDAGAPGTEIEAL